MYKLKSKSVKNAFLKDSVPTTKEYSFSKFELAELQNTQEIEESVSKSFLALNAFTTELRGGGSGGSGSGGGW